MAKSMGLYTPTFWGARFTQETQPQLMLTGPMGGYNSGAGANASNPAGGPAGGYTGNSFPPGGMPGYQGYSM